LTILMLSADMSVEDFVCLIDEEYENVVADNDDSDFDEDEAHCKDTRDNFSDESDEIGKDLSSTFAKAATKPDIGKSSSYGGGGRNAGGRRAFEPLSLNNLNVMDIGDDPREEADVEAYRKLVAWEASLQFRDENDGHS